MKKALSLILTLAMVACSFSSMSLFSASAYEEVTYEDEYISEHIFKADNLFKADTRYLDALQLTDSQLQSDTATLLDLVLNSSLLNPCYSSEPGFTEYPIVVDSFNGLQELEKRADASTVMVERYLIECLNNSYGYGNTIIIAKLNSLFIQDVYRNNLTVEDLNALRVADVCLEQQALWPTVTTS